MTGSIVLRGGGVATESSEVRADVRIDDGRISAIEPTIADAAGATVVDASGCVIAPGLVDMNTSLGQPGHEEAETLETGSRAAALGGYTAVVAIPNCDPPVDSAGVVREVRAYAASALCDIEVAGTITVGRDGAQLATMGEMAELGVRLFTDGDRAVQDDRLMRRAMEYSVGLNVTLAAHSDVASLSDGGHMNEGEWSSRLGIPGIPAEAEELMVMRDIALCRLTGARVHFSQLSTPGSIAMAAAARSQGLPVTVDVAPHHLTLTDQTCESFDALFKVSPPLRSAADVAAVQTALGDGSIDAIASGHRPWPAHEKDRPFDQAPAGMIGLETALAVINTELEMTFPEILQHMSSAPARIAGIEDRHGGPLAVDRPANIMVFDPAAAWTVAVDGGASLSRNTPFVGRKLMGRVRHTIVNGELVVHDGEATR